jgi:hypothetical protein
MDGVRVRWTPCFARPGNQMSDPGLPGPEISVRGQGAPASTQTLLELTV